MERDDSKYLGKVRLQHFKYDHDVYSGTRILCKKRCLIWSNNLLTAMKLKGVETCGLCEGLNDEHSSE